MNKQQAEHNLNLMIMDAMARIEGSGMFQEQYPELEARIWDAIDSRNIARLQSIIKELDGIQAEENI